MLTELELVFFPAAPKRYPGEPEVNSAEMKREFESNPTGRPLKEIWKLLGVN